MPHITLNGQVYVQEDKESVLDTLLRHQVNITHSCRTGICCTCVMRQTEGQVPEKAQGDLKSTLKAQQYFLACSYYPSEDIELAIPEQEKLYRPARVQQVETLTPSICRIRLDPPESFDYRPGQYIGLLRRDGLARSYSLASVPSLDPYLELHIRRQAHGAMSRWLYDTLQPGDEIQIQDPQGHCFYVPGQPEQPLLMVAAGTGLSPVLGVTRDALAQKHKGPIWIYHGGRQFSDLYLHSFLQQLQEQHSQLQYIPCVSSEGSAPNGIRQGRAHDVALKDHASLQGWRIFLCGNPDMVKTARKRAYLQGASLQEIFGDSFVMSPKPNF